MLDSSTPAREHINFYDPDRNRKVVLDASQFEGRSTTWARLHELFGDAAQPRLLSEYADMVGKPVADLLEPAPAVGRLAIREQERLENVQHARRFAPYEVAGYLEDGGGVRSIAIALRDSIVALTETGRISGAALSAEWYALIPQGKLRDGQNSVRAYVVNDASGRLRQAAEFDGAPSYLGMRLGAVDVSGVRASGFYGSFLRDGDTRRWASGLATLELATRPETWPTELQLDIVRSGPDGTHLRIVANAVTVFDRALTEGADVLRVPLDGVAFSETLKIELHSDVHVPSAVGMDPNDNRELGVLIRGIWLSAK